MRVGGVELTEQTDFTALAREVLTGRRGDLRRDDSYPVEWFFRAEEALARSPLLGKLTRGLACCLRDADLLVRRQAMLFFRQRPEALGAERVEEAAERDRASLADVPDPMHPNDTLEMALLDVLAARLVTSSPKALSLAREAALEPGKALPLAAGLAREDTDWLLTHAESVVRGTPAAAIAILVQLERLGRDYTALGEKLAPLAGAGFRDDVTRFLDDEAAKRRIVAAIR